MLTVALPPPRSGRRPPVPKGTLGPAGPPERIDIMTTIGRVRRDVDGFTGSFETLTRERPLSLVAATKVSARSPDFLVMAGDVDCGVAWRVSDNSGAVASVKLDDPSWPEPINARIMASEDGQLPLVWIRRSDPPATNAPASPTAAGSG